MSKLLKNLRSRITSMELWTLAFLILVIIYILPIWTFKYFPSQDGPCHIYNSFILKHYDNPEYVFSKFYEVRKSPIPNWASHFSMMLLMYLVPPLIAEKILLTGYIVLMALSMLYLLSAVEAGRTPLAFIGFPFIYNYLLLMGFYNFSLSVALLMLAVGYWWKHYETFDVKNMSILGLLLVVLYFCHLVSLVLAMLSIVTVAILRLPPRFTRWKQALFSLLCMLPAAGLTYYYTRTRGTAQSGVWAWERLWQYFIRNESLAYYSQEQIILGKFVTGAFIALFFYTFIRDRFFTKEWRFRLRISRKDFFLLLCVGFFIIYWQAPDGMSGGGFIKTRLSFLPFLIIIPWLSWDMPKIAKGIVGIMLMLLATAYIAHASYYHRNFSNDMKVYTSGYDVIERNKVILPLAFNRSGGCWRIGMFLHAVGHYGYATGCIELDNYEATTSYFPTYYKPDFRRPVHSIIESKPAEFDFDEYADGIDYVITWALPSGSDVESRILNHYYLIKQNGNLKIFQRGAHP
ncbi:hypothetical protein ACFL6S_26020 [Candidatus Poribacteria bacterium]